MITDAIKRVIEGKDLDEKTTVETFEEIMDGRATPSQIGAFLVALRMKGETIEEIVGAARVMRAKAAKIPIEGDLLDTCGTGGDGSGTFNISTATAIVAAACGLKVAKHGNRAASSKCGSADVLEALGVKVDAEPELVAKCINDAGIGFMFAPRMHAAMKHAIGPRKEIGVRTVFNMLGPLTNPAGAKRQLLGVYAKHLTEAMAAVLARLGSSHAMVVHGEDGLDEITLTGKTFVSELKNGEVIEYALEPSEFGLSRCRPEELRGGSAADNAAIVIKIFDGAKGPMRDAVLINSAAALYIAGKVEDWKRGIAQAADAIDSGAAKKTLKIFVERSNAG